MKKTQCNCNSKIHKCNCNSKIHKNLFNLETLIIAVLCSCKTSGDSCECDCECNSSFENGISNFNESESS